MERERSSRRRTLNRIGSNAWEDRTSKRAYILGHGQSQEEDGQFASLSVPVRTLVSSFSSISVDSESWCPA